MKTDADYGVARVHVSQLKVGDVITCPIGEPLFRVETQPDLHDCGAHSTMWLRHIGGMHDGCETVRTFAAHDRVYRRANEFAGIDLATHQGKDSDVTRQDGAQ